MIGQTLGNVWPSESSSASSARSDLPSLIIIMLIGVVLKVNDLGTPALWTDEILSRYFMDVFGYSFAVGEGLNVEPSPPTYTILLQGWMHLFGTSEVAIRSLSVVMSTLCVPLVYMLGRELGGRAAGLLAALLFTLSPMGLYYAQEARTYATMLPPVTLLILGCAILLRDPSSRGAALAYVVGAVLAIYLHATSVLIVAAAGFVLGLRFIGTLRADGYRPLARFAVLNLIVLALAAPYLLHLFSASGTGGLDWMPPLQLRNIVSSVTTVAVGMLTTRPFPGIPLAVVLFGAVGLALALRPIDRRALLVTVAIPLVFLALVIVMSLNKPILLPRVLTWTIVPLSVVIAIQLLQVGRLRWLVLASVVAAFGVGLFVQVTAGEDAKEPNRRAMAALEPAMRDADLVVISPRYNPMILKYYAPSVTRLVLWDAQLRPTIMNYAAKRLGIPTVSKRDVVQAVKQGKRVVAVANSIDGEYVDELRNALPGSRELSWNCGSAPCLQSLAWN